MTQNSFMQYRPLGRTGLNVSRLGLASAYGIGAASVERAFHEYRINYFYWGSRRTSQFGQALQNLARDNREKIHVVLQSYDHLGITLNCSITKGLRKLKFDYADIALLGWHNKIPPQKVIDTALELKEKGLIRYIAMSGHKRSAFGQIAQMEDSPIDIFMVRYNAVHRGAETDIFPHLPDSNRPGVTVYTATCWAKLLKAKKMPPGERPLSAADCYRFVLTNPHVDLCLMGPRSESEMLEGLKALESGPLSEEELDRARAIGDHLHKQK